MDHKEEQSSEVEALDSIYCGEMEILSTQPLHSFSIPIKSDDYDEEESSGIHCLLKFEYTPTYPEEIPIIEVEDVENLDESKVEELQEFLIQQASENLGMVMIFTLVSAAQEWVNTLSDNMRIRKQQAEEEKKKTEEEEERKKFEGTRVTIESFLAWKQAFEEEMGFLQQREKQGKNRKMTGKELFMTDKSLNESDLKFLEEGDLVKVDESLFQDMDDLEIDDNELDED
ncbi:unnamed protein product [Nesidiocoris tenuis]|uniref:Uncharacterized protein n=2 Tax=Nesidiocoris tenuis TaxID=355587 RepID=A0A6H5GAK3_9HEMI|nr:RWD domain-containing protein [Nesidiocoris tenuis]CAA9999957.1 unnamed protein product [Nesidiocoris tenuis]